MAGASNSRIARAEVCASYWICRWPPRSPEIPRSVEVGREIGMLGMMEHSVDLRCGGAPQRQRRQGIAGKERHLAGLVARTGGASGDLANEEHLVNGVDVARRVTAALIVAHGRELARPGKKSRLFGDFPHHAFGGRLVDVGPAAGKSPMAIADFAHPEE